MTTHERRGSVGGWAWFLPMAYGAHVLEEAFGGRGFTAWMAAGGGVRLSLAAFIGLNLVGAGMLCLAAWAARRSKGWRWLLASGATIVLVNGVWHAALCAAARAYVPGVGTGLFLYVPLGAMMLHRLRWLVSPLIFISAIAVGLAIHRAVLWIVL